MNLKLSHKLQKLISWLFIVLISILPFIFCWLSDELFEFNKMLIVYTFSIAIGSAYLARMIFEKQFIWKKTIFSWPILLFLSSQIITTILSMHPRTSFLGYYTRLNGGLLSTFAYITLFYAFLNNVDSKHQRYFWISTFISSILVSLYAIGEHFGHSFSCLIIKGDFDVSCWVQDVQTRVFASFGQPNWLAAYNVIILGLSIPFILKLTSQWRNKKFTLCIATLALYLNFLSLIFTRSRSGILAFFIGLAFTIVALIFVWWRQKTFTKRRLGILSLVLLGLTLPALIWGTQYTPSWSQLTNTIAAQSQLLTNSNAIPLNLPSHLQNLDLKITDSADIRKIVWQGALNIWKDHLLFGTGVETFAYSYYNYRPTDHNWTSEWDFLYNKAHNELLNYAANSGLFGLITYLSIFAFLGIYVIKFLWQRPANPMAQLDHYYQSLNLIGICAALIALSVTNFFGFSTVTVQVLLFICLAWAASILLKSESQKPQKLLSSSLSWFLLILLGATTLYLFNQVWATWYADFNYARCKNLIGKTDTANALNYCHRAVKIKPKEALYLIDLGDFYAQYALALAKKDPNSDLITQLANESLGLSNQAMAFNSANLNFYKTRFKTMSTLAALDPQALQIARETMEKALQLSPTDPKLTFYYSTLLETLDLPQESQLWLDKTLQLRPIYLDARLAAAKKAQKRGDLIQALTHYQFVIDYIESDNPVANKEISTLATISGSLTP